MSREHISDSFDFHHVKCESGIDSSVLPIILFKVGDRYDVCLLQDTATKVSTNHRGMFGINISDELKRSSPYPTDQCVNRDVKSNDEIVDSDMKNDIVNHCFDDAVPLEMSTCSTPGIISNVTGNHSPYSNENCVDRNVKSQDENTDIFKDATDFRSKFKSNFILLHNNINSLRYRFMHLHEILSKKSVDFLAISETKLDDSFTSAQFHAGGFPLHRQDCTCSSGGILLYVRSDIAHRRIRKFECNFDSIESICMELNLGKTKTMISVIYKHPRVADNVFLQNLGRMADAQCVSNDDFVYVGDMNCAPK